MKIFFSFISMLSGLCSFAQLTLSDVGVGEYVHINVASDHRAYYQKLDGGNASWTITAIGYNILKADAGQYNGIFLHLNGAVSIFNSHRDDTQVPTADSVTIDSLGNSFTGNRSILTSYKTYLVIDSLGNIKCWGIDMYDVNRNGRNTDTILKPATMPNTTGSTFTKIDHYNGGLGALGVEGELVGMTADGKVWKYSKAAANPVEIYRTGSTSFSAKDIACVNSSVIVVYTTDEKLFIWGYLGNNFGGSALETTPQDRTSLWTSAGVVFPLKEVVGNINTLHVIDANDHLFGAGDNVQGEVGNGEQYPDWRNYKVSSIRYPFAWAFQHNERVKAVTWLPGEYENLQTNNSLACQLFVQNKWTHEWLSWGRNKGDALQNGRILNATDGADFPDWENNPAPRVVTPLTVTRSLVGGGTFFDGAHRFDTTANQLPLVNAGVSRTINTDTVTAYGSWSSTQNATFTSYSWTKTSGPSCSFQTPISANTAIRFSGIGTYVLQLSGTNSNGAIGTSTVTFTVGDPVPDKKILKGQR